MQFYIGQIVQFAGTYVPSTDDGFIPCDGRLLDISAYPTLYTLLGTSYGGDGQTNFGVPDLVGAVPIGMGASTTGTAYTLGQTGGVATVTLNSNQSASHTHALYVSGGAFATTAVGQKTGTKSGFNRYSLSSTNVSLAPGSLAPNGSGAQPHNTMQPYLGMTDFMCIEGLFPPRS